MTRSWRGRLKGFWGFDFTPRVMQERDNLTPGYYRYVKSVLIAPLLKQERDLAGTLYSATEKLLRAGLLLPSPVLGEGTVRLCRNTG
jgi:hypothetical protein